MLSRREVLAGLVAVTAGTLAACRGEVTVPPRTGGPTPIGSSQRNPTITPSQAASSDAAAVSEVPTASEPPKPAALVVPALCRDAWGAAPARASESSHVPVTLTLHHTAVALDDNRQAPARLRGHQRYHQDSGFTDIAYHVGVDRNGHVYELRDPGVPGETFTAYDPTGHFLVLAEGEFGTQMPTDAQLEGLASVVAAAAVQYGIAVETLAGHRDHSPDTACPGDNLHARLPDLRARAEQIIRDGRPALQSWCDEDAFERVAAIERGEA